MTGSNHFERLGLPRRFVLDEADLEREYLARSRATHPDFHQGGSSSEQLASLELSAALNEAYTTLRDPFRRAEYLLQSEGGPTASEHRQMPPAFLAEMLELREQMEELKAEGPDSAGMIALMRQLGERQKGFQDAIAAAFTAYDTSGDRGLLLKVREALNAWKYVRGLIRDGKA